MYKLKTLLKGVKIIDGTGSAPIESGEMLIDGELIVEVGALNTIDIDVSDTEVVDLSNKVMLPGLINSHVHILADAHLDASLFVALQESQTLSAFRGYLNMKELLASGITYARDLGAPDYINIELKKARIMGLIDGAEIVTSGKCLTTTGGHIWQISRQCDGVAEVRKAAREQLRAGADCIKLLITGGHSTPGIHPKHLQFTPDEVRAAAEIAHFAHKKIAAHTNGLEAIEMAVDCGVDCIEHCEFFPEDDPVRVDELVHKMAEKGTYYVPTLSTWFRSYPQNYGYLGEIKKEVLGEMLLRQPDNIRIMTMDREYFSMQQILDNAIRLYQAGVKVVMGTDSGISGLYFNKYPFEMKCMLLMGMSPMEVILSASKTAAQLLGIDRHYGTLEKGKFADLLILDHDPLANMDALYDIHQVYKKGRPVR